MKRKNGQEIVDVPQPKWPELAYFEGETMHRIIPRVLANGAAEYDVSKMGPEAEVLVKAAVVDKLPANRKETVVVKAADIKAAVRK
jgi:hypothetical protein